MIPLASPFEFYRTFLEWYITQTQARTYLEVGCADGGLVERLSPLLHVAVGLDIAHFERLPVNGVKWVTMSSDEFFSRNTIKYDVIFIDGDHTDAQVLKDVDNALKCLESSGLILLHDTYPPNQEFTASDKCGTAWKAAKHLEGRGDIETFTFPVTYGLTLVRKVGGDPWLLM